ncbi:MAG TPA: hypothetical protein PKG80_10680, partial [Acidobacteriota bacterium]|nr:hypothetical protein [Acidobacteriota bacterium]
MFEQADAASALREVLSRPEESTSLTAGALAIARLGGRLPDGEAIPIALHLVNAQFSTPDMRRTMIVTELLDQVFDVLDEFF